MHNADKHEGKALRLVGRGLYIGKYPPPPRGGISSNVIWGKKYEKGKRKKGKMRKKKEERGKKKK
jgi:hypothetical protein